MKNKGNIMSSDFKHFNSMTRNSSRFDNDNSSFWFDDSPRTSIFDEDNQEVNICDIKLKILEMFNVS